MKKLLALLLLSLPITSYAIEYKVLAVVNGQSISTEQVKERVKLVMKTTGMPDSAANRNKVTREVTDILINEVLQKQEAKEKGIELTPAEINAVYADLEKGNKLKPGGFKDFVRAKGISYSSIRDQIEASLLWKKILGTYVRPRVEITEEDIKKAQSYTPAAKPKAEVRTFASLSEIIIPIEFGKEQEAKDLADTIVRTARAGTEDFGDLAKRYSVGKTGPNKGKVGWVPEAGMIEPLASTVKKTATGKIADPVKAQSMYVILRVNDRKTDEPPAETKLSPKDRALMTKMEDGAKKYIKGLRDKAFIEKKYKEDSLINTVWG